MATLKPYLPWIVGLGLVVALVYAWNLGAADGQRPKFQPV